MSDCKTKTVHDKFQNDVKAFQETQTNSVVDVMVYRYVQSGNTSLESISKRFKMTSSRLLAAISDKLFKVDGDNISLSN
ncbi:MULTISPECIES: hypothetical protein [unclassified Vibrio]|uniref:hypothetical protein n=1 Tax=unclassified Vibrio TaxID=2614977 RepID=UPI00126803A4|nr:MULTISPECIES: hypothetical protein [unclassified Vibrio]QFT40035.1 hypothetical protein FIU99_26965 [Vibrio sp. THAF64]QGM37980.1 hypothetical protein GGC04_27170 [Vibrio sp. THAF191d]QGN73440.1 hypothetical protein GGC03_27005 [Vibrio sp. THAF191c]